MPGPTVTSLNHSNETHPLSRPHRRPFPFPSGSLPPSLALPDALWALRVLDLSNCPRLTGEIPCEVLRMGQSSASGGRGVAVNTEGCTFTLPKDMTSLAGLRELNLQG